MSNDTLNLADDRLRQVLKSRERTIKKKLKNQEAKYSRLKYKSRTVRQDSALGPRIGWLTDRLQELQLIIGFIDGKYSEKEFKHWLIDDETGNMLTFIGGG